ncbi:MAG TPA: NYN domain-containing protein [Ktedonobacteraceae bacterium]|nr:NYN domain-containing protein [Ktedonobacteraceae bacterium]
MTTHNHHEDHDVDTNVVENSLTPKSETDLAASDATPSTADEEAGAQNTAPDTTPMMQNQQQEEEQQSKSATPAPASSETPEPEVQQESIPATPVEDDTHVATATPAEQVEAEMGDPAAPATSKEEAEIRPFTAFIEEFRQAEARLTASTQEADSNVFQLFPPSEAASQHSVNEQEPSPESPLEAVIESIAEAQTETAQAFPQELVADHTEENNDTTIAETAASAPAHEEATVMPQEQKDNTQQEQEGKATEETTVANKPATYERAVSPLLRPPSSRMRLPRHGTARHREPLAENPPTATPDEQTATAMSGATDKTATSTSESATPEAEKPAEAEKPRPARRYRFDRPSTTSNTTSKATRATHTSSVAKPAEENRAQVAHDVPAPNVAEPLAETNATNGKSTPTVTSTANEQPTAKNGNTQEASVAEANGSIPEKEHNGRKRPTHERAERAKEQQKAQTPAPEVQAAPAETTEAPPTEIAPEDLPPLEYADLQKANSRRRRRHRPGTSVSPNHTVGTPKAHNVPAPMPPAPTQPAPAPVNAASPAANQVPPAPQQQYTIVSGYTVNQMNQGNDDNSPFMGPEPSPARGSLFTREGRVPSRSELQRGPTTHSYTPARSTADLSSAMLNQFSGAISQAIQTQTDRMVSEFRRVAQSPTNVSVSLPPFPSSERVGVFVDVANLLYSARTLRLSVDFGKLLDFLRGNRRLIRAHAYCPTSPQPGDEQMFLRAVKGLGYRITTKDYKTFSSGAKKADMDLDLCMDVVRIVDGGAVDCIVLVSGDGDFMPMLDYCADHGVRVEVAAFDEATSATLRQGCDLFINLSMLDGILANS